MKTVSFEEIGNLTATFMAASDVTEGSVVKTFGSCTVRTCIEGETFCGLAGKPCGDTVAVQLRGFMRVRCTEDLPFGSCNVVADGKGGIKQGNGVHVVVIDQALSEGTALIFM